MSAHRTHVLLIEPDRILARLYTRALRRAGLSVDCAQSAQAAISCADARTPDVVVLELQLAAHSGAAFLYEFRSYTDWSQVPIIVQTVIPPVSLHGFSESLKELGVVDCLYKPHTDLRNLVAAIRRYVPDKTVL